ncbi:MAG: MGMT family protein [Acidobacteriia bacterium]|nr:MGMT family protein [Terriglobia bacterium]
MHWKIAYAQVKKIPRGRVMTYGQLAAAVKLPGGARSAGRAMAASPSGKGIPWHRVVGAGGRLLLREPNVWMQRRLLESEGVRVAERRILDFKMRQWLPVRKKRKA